MRLRFIKGKLSSLRKNQAHRPDVLYQTEESHLAHDRLLKCLINCEVMYQKSNLKNCNGCNLLNEMYEIDLNLTFRPITQRWDEIAARIRPPFI